MIPLSDAMATFFALFVLCSYYLRAALESTQISLMTEYSMHGEMGYRVTCTAGQTFYLSALSHVNELWNTNHLSVVFVQSFPFYAINYSVAASA